MQLKVGLEYYPSLQSSPLVGSDLEFSDTDP